jgi:oligoribonuclease NrnB/cAMP/cGMP phosphodiesterase (DHH superfamily)
MYGIDYGQPFPWDKVKDRTVLMVDFSLQPWEDMIRLQKEAKWFLWIDHHKTAIDAYQQARHDLGIKEFEGRWEVGMAGCELAWLEFFEGKEMPTAVKLLGRYDVWDIFSTAFKPLTHNWDDLILPFQYGIRNHDHGPFDQIWEDLLTVGPEATDLVFSIIQEGKTLLAWEERQNAAYSKARAFKATLDGHTVIACNKGLANSKLFDAVWDPKKYEMMMLFCLRPDGQWKIGLYTTREDVDCSEVAKAHGGGGHRKAAGWTTRDLGFFTMPEAPTPAPRALEVVHGG